LVKPTGVAIPETKKGSAIRGVRKAGTSRPGPHSSAFDVAVGVKTMGTGNLSLGTMYGHPFGYEEGSAERHKEQKRIAYS